LRGRARILGCICPKRPFRDRSYHPSIMRKMRIHGKHETEWITIPLEEFEALNRTIAVLSDENIMAQIRKGRQRNTRSRDFEEFVKELLI
jgi:hypothetical protein